MKFSVIETQGQLIKFQVILSDHTLRAEENNRSDWSSAMLYIERMVALMGGNFQLEELGTQIRITLIASCIKDESNLSEKVI